MLETYAKIRESELIQEDYALQSKARVVNLMIRDHLVFK